MSDQSVMVELDQVEVHSEFILTHATDKVARRDRTRLLYLMVSEDFRGKNECLVEDLNKKPVRIDIRPNSK